jgi:hypothetical protein
LSAPTGCDSTYGGALWYFSYEDREIPPAGVGAASFGATPHTGRFRALRAPTFGNQEVQVQTSVALDPIDSTNERCERVARESYEVGLAALKPGLGFADLVTIMAEPLRAGRGLLGVHAARPLREPAFPARPHVHQSGGTRFSSPLRPDAAQPQIEKPWTGAPPAG